jgi:hypothetical protein
MGVRFVSHIEETRVNECVDINFTSKIFECKREEVPTELEGKL